jgi:hypothetical protein
MQSLLVSERVKSEDCSHQLQPPDVDLLQKGKIVHNGAMPIKSNGAALHALPLKQEENCQLGSSPAAQQVRLRNTCCLNSWVLPILAVLFESPVSAEGGLRIKINYQIPIKYTAI